MKPAIVLVILAIGAGLGATVYYVTREVYVNPPSADRVSSSSEVSSSAAPIPSSSISSSSSSSSSLPTSSSIPTSSKSSESKSSSVEPSSSISSSASTSSASSGHLSSEEYSSSSEPEEVIEVTLSWGDSSGFGEFIIIPGQTVKIGSVSLVSDHPEYQGNLSVTIKENGDYSAAPYRLRDYVEVSLVSGDVSTIYDGDLIFTIPQDGVYQNSTLANGDSIGSSKYSVFVKMPYLSHDIRQQLLEQSIDVSVDWGAA